MWCDKGPYFHQQDTCVQIFEFGLEIIIVNLVFLFNHAQGNWAQFYAKDTNCVLCSVQDLLFSIVL